MNSRIVRSDCSLPAGRLWKAGLVDESLWRQMEQMRLKMVTVPPKFKTSGMSPRMFICAAKNAKNPSRSSLASMSPPSSAKWPQKTMSLVRFTLKETLREKKGCWKAWTKRNVYIVYTSFPQVTSYQFINTYIHIFCTYVTCPDVNKHLFNTTTIQYITTLTGIHNGCTLHRVTGTPYVALFDAFTHLSGYPVDRKGHWDVGF